MKKKLLWISYLAPYDKVSHAGGKVHNYQIKKFNFSKKFDIRLVSFCYPEEEEKLDISSYGIENYVFSIPHEKPFGFKWWNRIEMLWGKGSCMSSLDYIRRNKLLKLLHQYIDEGYCPDVIFLQWTEIIMLIEDIQKIFPNVKIVVIEEDVWYLTRKRLYEQSKGLNKIYRKWSFQKVKYNELSTLNKADLIILNNPKDQKLIIKDGLNKKDSMVVTPYFENMFEVERNNINNDILYYGAMGRYVNDVSARWFLDYVFPIVHKEFPTVRFVIVGSHPTDELLKYKSESVIITGFVDSVKPYFEHSKCLVAPLQLGAGVKIKILEGLSSGIPVLTNSIGIEGIPAVDNKHYFHCETAEDYVNKLREILVNQTSSEVIGEQGKQFIYANYDLENSVDKMICKTLEMLNERVVLQ